MLDILVRKLLALGETEAGKIFIAAANNMFKKHKTKQELRKLFINTGEKITKFEKNEISFFYDLKDVFSKKNMSGVAKEIQIVDGYEFKDKLYNILIDLMGEYDIPHEYAELYTNKFMIIVLDELRRIEPKQYNQYFLKSWREEEQQNQNELLVRLDKILKTFEIFNLSRIKILSSGQMDLKLRHSTHHPSIGVNFFTVDDEIFQKKFENCRNQEVIYIKSRCKEETIYCILNELWRIKEKRPIYVVKNLESWEILQNNGGEQNIYIPWFYAEEIVAIKNNTNIFVLDENTPEFTKDVLELRPRTQKTLIKCLQNAGMEYKEASDLLKDTNGLYIPMKKKFYKGQILKAPKWYDELSNKAKAVCLLLEGWEEIEGDKLIIEKLYEDSYDRFVEEIMPYTRGEDPLLSKRERNGTNFYYIASTENAWCLLDNTIYDSIWEKFKSIILKLFTEYESSFMYQININYRTKIEEKTIFCSKMIVKGMLKTLIIKATYVKNERKKYELNELIKKILQNIKSIEQWSFISYFWAEFCEIAPEVILERLEKEIKNPTELWKLFDKPAIDSPFGNIVCDKIFSGIEQFLVQEDYFWFSFRWLLILDSKKFEYPKNSLKDIFEKIFYPRFHYSAITSAEEKIKAARMALEISCDNAWEYLYNVLDKNDSVFITLSIPKYRKCSTPKIATSNEIAKTKKGYFNLLLNQVDYYSHRWKKILNLSTNLTTSSRIRVFKQLLNEIKKMSDSDVIDIKNSLRRIIYKNRFFNTSSWALKENEICEYEKLLETIHTSSTEYEYCYLFINFQNIPIIPLLNPEPFIDENSIRKNNELGIKLIQKKLLEFKKNNYDIEKLIKICAQQSDNNLGVCLAQFWNNGKWNFDLFLKLLKYQNSGRMAFDYLCEIIKNTIVPYNEIIDTLKYLGYSDRIIVKIYRLEAMNTENIPLISEASPSFKKIFWETIIDCKSCNIHWALTECKNYASTQTCLKQIWILYFKHKNELTPEQIFSFFVGFNKPINFQENQIMKYPITQLIKEIQNEYINNNEKCKKIAKIEMLFVEILDWKDMKCSQKIIKKSPRLFAGILKNIFKRDHGKENYSTSNGLFSKTMYILYSKAQFCPAEENGEVKEKELESWIIEFQSLLMQNDQENRFSSALGRLFSFSPKGIDGYEPCEAVRSMIEKYGDKKMIDHYLIAVINRRSVFTSTAGKTEMKMANSYKEKADYLKPHYPKTAQIFTKLYETYTNFAEKEREEAEDGLY